MAHQPGATVEGGDERGGDRGEPGGISVQKRKRDRRRELKKKKEKKLLGYRVGLQIP